jgi:hypothetical protein
MFKNLRILVVFISILTLLNNCGFYRPTDARKVSPDPEKRVQKNIEEGRGLRLSNLTSNGKTNFQFASSNPLWRATLEKLDFIPLVNVDYAGGILITDWYGDTQSNEQIKVSVRFLTNEIRSDALDITIFKKICQANNSCETTKIENNTNVEIKKSILKRAAELSKENNIK